MLHITTILFLSVKKKSFKLTSGTGSIDYFWFFLCSYFLRSYTQTKRRGSRAKLSTAPSKKIQTVEFREQRKPNIQTIQPCCRLWTSLLQRSQLGGPLLIETAIKD